MKILLARLYCKQDKMVECDPEEVHQVCCHRLDPKGSKGVKF